MSLKGGTAANPSLIWPPAQDYVYLTNQRPASYSTQCHSFNNHRSSTQQALPTGPGCSTVLRLREAVLQIPPLIGIKDGSFCYLAKVLCLDIPMSYPAQLRRHEVCLVMVELLPSSILEENSISTFRYLTVLLALSNLLNIQ